jgi:hypothetical protein
VRNKRQFTLDQLCIRKFYKAWRITALLEWRIHGCDQHAAKGKAIHAVFPYIMMRSSIACSSEAGPTVGDRFLMAGSRIVASSASAELLGRTMC